MTRPDRDQLRLTGIGGRADRARRMRRAVESQLKNLRDTGRLEAADAVLVAAQRTLADAWDETVADPDGSPYTEGTLAKVMLANDAVLRGGRDGGPGVGLDDELAAIVAAIRDAPRSDAPDTR